MGQIFAVKVCASENFSVRKMGFQILTWGILGSFKKLTSAYQKHWRRCFMVSADIFLEVLASLAFKLKLTQSVSHTFSGLQSLYSFYV